MGRIKVKKKSKVLPADAELLKAIVRYRGGADKISERIDVEAQIITNWVHRGAVPLKHIVRIGRLLDVNPYCLNYKGYYTMMETGPSFKSLLKEITFFPVKVTDMILSRKEPVIE